MLIPPEMCAFAHLTSVAQVGEGDEGDADAACLGALLLGLEGLSEVVLLPLVECEGVHLVAATADNAAGEGPHLLPRPVLTAVVLAVHPGASRPLALPVQRAEFGDVVSDLHVVDLAGGVGLVEVPPDELLRAVRLGHAHDHQRARADAVLVVLEPEVDREPPHDGDAEDGE